MAMSMFLKLLFHLLDLGLHPFIPKLALKHDAEVDSEFDKTDYS